MNIIDTHTHLNVYDFEEDIDEVIERAKEVGVKKVINNGDTLGSFEPINNLARKYNDFCYSALGIFPDAGTGNNEKDIIRLEEELKNATNLVAIGEIGLDFHLNKTKELKERQKDLFRRQIEVAKKFNLPIIIHSRDADEETFNLLMESKFEGNITLHCYSGSVELARRYIANHKNTFFGIGGVVTFKNARRLVEVVEGIDLEHLVTETDAPYLAPVPHRGTRNEPSYLIETIAKIAEIKQMDIETVANKLYENAKRVYNLWRISM